MFGKVVLRQHMAQTCAPTPQNGQALLASRPVRPLPARGGHLPVLLVLGVCALCARESRGQQTHHECTQGWTPLVGHTRTARGPHAAGLQVSSERVTLLLACASSSALAASHWLPPRYSL